MGPDVNRAFTSQGYNLIGKSNDSTGFTNGVNNDQVGSIAVVYDGRAHAVRVSTFRFGRPAWTLYPNTPVTFVNGNKLTGCVKANGVVTIYKNNVLVATVTLNAADQAFFNSRGGKIGLWTLFAENAFFDDFGGGTVTP